MVGARLANLSHGQKKADVEISTVTTSQSESAKLLNVSERGDRSKPEISDLGRGDNQHAPIGAMSQFISQHNSFYVLFMFLTCTR